jgi:hypothetical protein
MFANFQQLDCEFAPFGLRICGGSVGPVGVLLALAIETKIFSISQLSTLNFGLGSLHIGDTGVVFVFVGQNRAGFKQQASNYLSNQFQRLAASDMHT